MSHYVRLAAFTLRSLLTAACRTSLNDRKNGAEPAAAPLRAKIAQFESKGGVPVPRGKFDSFGSAAPPPQQNKQRRELYGNRMKPVWVPGAKVGESALDRTRNERLEARRARVVEEDGLVRRCPGHRVSGSI